MEERGRVGKGEMEETVIAGHAALSQPMGKWRRVRMMSSGAIIQLMEAKYYGRRQRGRRMSKEWGSSFLGWARCLDMPRHADGQRVRCMKSWKGMYGWIGKGGKVEKGWRRGDGGDFQVECITSEGLVYMFVHACWITSLHDLDTTSAVKQSRVQHGPHCRVEFVVAIATLGAWTSLCR